MMTRWVIDVGAKHYSVYAENRLQATRLLRSAGVKTNGVGFVERRLEDEPTKVFEDWWKKK